MKGLPKGWEIVKMSELCKVVNGSTPKTANKEFWDGDILWITPRDLTGFKDVIINDTIRKITKKGYDSCPTQLVPRGTVLMSSRAPIGHLAIAGKEMCTNQGFKSFVCSNRLNNRYLYYHLKSIVPQLKQEGQGTTFDELSKTKAENIEVPIPFPHDKEKSLKIQKQIVAKLDAFFKEYDILKDEKEKAQENYDKILQSAVKKLVSPDDIPSAWRKAKIGDERVCKTITSGGTPDRKKLEYYENGTIPWIKSGELKDSEILSAEESINESGLKNSSAKFFEPNTVLVAMYGANVGKTAILKIKATTNQAVCGLTANEEVLRYEYLFYYFLSKKNELLNKSFGGAQSNISQGVIKELEIIIPPLNQQDEILKRIKEIVNFRSIVVEEQKALNINLKHLPHSVLTKAFAGELTA